MIGEGLQKNFYWGVMIEYNGEGSEGKVGENIEDLNPQISLRKESSNMGSCIRCSLLFIRTSKELTKLSRTLPTITRVSKILFAP